jgi:hypothetical protein
MKRRFVALSVLLAVIGVLAFFLWHQAQRPVTAATPLYAIAPQTVTAISARWASGERIALRRSPHGWRLIAPVQAPADATRVDAFIDALAEPVMHRYSVSAVPLARAGLAPAYLSLRIDSRLVEFGHTNPATGLRYVRRGRYILMVADTLVPRLAAGPWQFVSNRLLPPDTTVQSVQLDGEAMRNNPHLLAAWQQAVATRVGPANSPPSRPIAQIRLRLTRRSHPLVFNLLARRPQLRLERADSKLVYTFPATTASRLLPTPAHARATGS